MAASLKFVRRLALSAREAAPEPTKSPVSITIEQSQARQIYNLPEEYRDLIVEAIIDGGSNGDIAAFIVSEGILQVTEKTAIQYIIAFKRLHRELIHGPAPDLANAATPSNPKQNLNQVVSKRRPPLNTDKELEQLIRVNNLRLRRGVQFEIATGVVNKDLHKDIGQHIEAIKTLASLRGQISGAGRPPTNATTLMTHEATEQLRKADTSEASQDKLLGLTSTLAKLLQEKNAS